MSTSQPSPEPGWYHADGDDPGTVRRWNGSDWIGFPQRDPNVAVTALAAPAEFERVAGQIMLRPFAILAQVSLSALALVYALGAIVMWIFAATVGPETLADGSPAPSSDFSQAATETDGGILEGILGFAMLGFWVAAVIAPVLFLIWFWRAYANMGLWRENKYDSFWTVLAWLIPFMNMRRPCSMVLELMEHSPSAEKEGAINPVLGVVWWLLYLVPGFIWTIIFFGAVSDVSELATNPEGFATGVIVTLAVTLTMSALSLVSLIMIISKVTFYQDLRRRPNEAQVQYYESQQGETAPVSQGSVDGPAESFVF